jgi:hypothetical protein
MNTVTYLQFFDGLAEKNQGKFLMERVSSKICRPDRSGKTFTHCCDFIMGKQHYSSQGNSRKEALKVLYRKLQKFGNR